MAAVALQQLHLCLPIVFANVIISTIKIRPTAGVLLLQFVAFDEPLHDDIFCP